MGNAGSPVRTGLIAVVLLAGAGCNDFRVGDGLDPSDEQPPLTLTEAAAVVNETREELAAIARGLGVDGFLSPRVQLPVESMSRVSPATSFTRARNCARLSESPWSDSDDDRIPDDVTVTYDSTRCTFISSGGRARYILRGQVRIIDPSSAAAAVRLRFNNLDQRLRLDDSLTWLRRTSGEVRLAAGGGGFTGSDSGVVVRQVPGRAGASLAKVWNLSFVSGEKFDPRRALPTGVLTVEGSLVRSAGGFDRRLLLHTASALVVDDDCDVGERLTDGSLEFRLDRPSGGTAIKVTWRGCGNEPSVVVNPQPPGT